MALSGWSDHYEMLMDAVAAVTGHVYIQCLYVLKTSAFVKMVTGRRCFQIAFATQFVCEFESPMQKHSPRTSALMLWFTYKHIQA